MTYAEPSPKSGFYSIVDGQGRLVVIRTDTKTSKVEKKQKVTAEALKANISKTSVLEPELNEQEFLKPTLEKNKTTRLEGSKEKAPLEQKTLMKNKVEQSSPLSSTTKQQSKGIDGTNQDSLEIKRPLITKPFQGNTEISDSHNAMRSALSKGSGQKPEKTQALVSTKQNEPTKTLVNFQDDKYVDSQILIEKSFNIEDEKRFYALPNGSGSVDYVERKSGVNLRNFNPAPSSGLFNTSSSYHRISRNDLSELLPSECVNQSALNNIDKLKSKEALNLWPREGKTDDFYANIITLHKNTREISIVSYAKSSSAPTYYWPLPIFLDRNGCVIEAVGQYFQKDIPATWLQQSGLKGNLLAPENASYLMLTPLAESPDLPNKTLSQSGQLRLSVFGVEP